MVLKRIFGSRRAVFFATFVVVVLSGLWVGGMLLRAWVLGPLDNPLLAVMREAGISQYFVVGIIAGAYFGVSLPLLFDPMKRTQGAFLSVVWVGVIFVLPISATVVIPEWTMSRYLNYLVAPLPLSGCIVGLAVGLWAGGFGQVVGGDFDVDSFRLKRANVGIAVLTGIILLLGLIEAHLRISYLFSTPGPQFRMAELFFAFGSQPLQVDFGIPYFVFLFFDVLIAPVFFMSVWQFVGYVDKKDVSAVGPKRYGKTHFMIGLYDTVDQIDGTTDEEYSLSQKHTQLLNTGSWLEPTKGDPERLWFEYIHGIVHKHKRTVTMFDFPGEIFQYIKYGLDVSSREALEERIASDLRESADENDQNAGNGGNGHEEDDSAAETADQYASQLYDTRFVDEIERADTVLMLVDMKKLKHSISDDQELAGQIDEPASAQGWDSPGTGSTGDGYDWKSDSSFGKASSDGGSSQTRTDTQGSDKPWESEDATASKYQEGEDLDDIPEIPTAEYKHLQSQLDAKTAVVATKAHVYEEDVPYGNVEDNYSRYQDFIKSKLNEHAVGSVVSRADLGLYPVFIRGDSAGPDTGRGQSKLSTFGFEELKEALEK